MYDVVLKIQYFGLSNNALTINKYINVLKTKGKLFKTVKNPFIFDECKTEKYVCNSIV